MLEIKGENWESEKTDIKGDLENKEITSLEVKFQRII